MKKGTPHYALDAVIDAARKGRIWIVGAQVRDDALALGFSEWDIRRAIFALTTACFQHAIIAKNVPYAGALLDVYKTTFRGRRIYLKFHYSETGFVSVTSFKKV